MEGSGRTFRTASTPFGEIVALSQRGMFTGNRGIIHDSATKTLLNRCWATKTWLVCSCEYKGRRRAVMAGRSWTDLFFLDEAVALAAGHRSCFVCRREAAERFRDFWAAAKGGLRPSRQNDRQRLASRADRAWPQACPSDPWAVGCTSRWRDGRGSRIGLYPPLCRTSPSMDKRGLCPTGAPSPR